MAKSASYFFPELLLFGAAVGKKKRATKKQKSISHPRVKGKREKVMKEEEVESRYICCKREGRKREGEIE